MAVFRNQGGRLLLRRQPGEIRTLLPRAATLEYAKKLHPLWDEVFKEARGFGIETVLLKHDSKQLEEWTPVLRLFKGELRKLRRKYRAMHAMKAPLGQVYAFDAQRGE